MTFILIVSSVTMVLAVEAGHPRQGRRVGAVIGGLFFLPKRGMVSLRHGAGVLPTEQAVTVTADNGETFSLTGDLVYMDHRWTGDHGARVTPR